MSAEVVTCPSCGARNRSRPPVGTTPRCGKCHANLPWIVDAGTDGFDDAVAGPVPVLVDFWAAWCGPCRTLAPILEELAGRHPGDLKIVKVDVDANQELAVRYTVQGIPTLLLFVDGSPVDRVTGSLPLDALEQRLQPHLG